MLGTNQWEFYVAAGTILLVALPFHEFSHALAAYRLGDGTAKLLGRLTLNPFAHLDPLGSILILVAGFGWAKPTPYNPYNLRGGRSGEGIVAVAGPVSNLVLAVAAAIPYRYIELSGITVPDAVMLTLFYFVYINVALFAFNLIPLPPLDGSKVLYALLDERTVRDLRPTLDQYGPFLLLALIFVPQFVPGMPDPLGIWFDVIGDPIRNFLLGT